MKKILLNGNTSFVIYNFRYGLMEELENRGYKVVVVAGEDGSTKLIKEKGWRFIPIKIDRRGKNILNDLKLFIQYYQIYRKEKPDYVLNFTIKPNIYSTLAAKIAGIDVLNNVTGLGDTFNSNNLTNKIIKFLYKISFKFPKAIFFQNDDDMNIFLENNLISRQKCIRIPGSGVNLEKFNLTEKKEKNDKIKLLFIGRISENKGVRIAYEVAKKIKSKYPNIEIQLLGKIYEDEKGHIPEKELLEWEKECNIKYLGTSKDVRNEIKEADAIIFPSYYREGVPRSLIEAAAMGKIILTTDNVGCRDIANEGYNGFLAQIKSVDSMVKQIEKYMNLTSEEKKNMEKNSRKKAVEEFDERIVISKYLEVIEA